MARDVAAGLQTVTFLDRPSGFTGSAIGAPRSGIVWAVTNGSDVKLPSLAELAHMGYNWAMLDNQRMP